MLPPTMGQFGESELLKYVAHLAESLLLVAEALYGGHQIGFPDVRGVSRQAVMVPQYLEVVLREVSDRMVVEELQAMQSDAKKLLGIDEMMALWLSQYHKLAPPTDETSKERLLRLVEAKSAKAAHAGVFPPEWVRESRYKELLGLATMAIEGMRVHKSRIDRRISELLA